MPKRGMDLAIEFSIDPQVAQKFSGLHIGVVEGECSANSFSDRSAFEELRKLTVAAVQDVQPLAEHPHVVAWRKAFKLMGLDPTKTRSSGEAIARRVQKGDSLPDINPIVDVYNAISLKHLIPIGGQDQLRLTGQVVLRFSRAGDRFIRLGGTEPEELDGGEVVYADSKQVLCSKWNYRDCEPAKISSDTTKFVLFVDGAPGISEEDVALASRELSQTLDKLIKGCSTASRIVA
jgi:lysyl-tRNA synthetase class 2